MQRPPSPADRPPVVRGLRHVLLAGLLGMVAALFGTQVVVAAAFGGVVPLIVGVLLVTAAVSGLAIVLDRSVGPGLGDTDGSMNRGTLLGVAGCALVLLLGWTALRNDIGDDADVPERVLEEALRNARPMSDEAYDDWLDVMLSVPLS